MRGNRPRAAHAVGAMLAVVAALAGCASTSQAPAPVAAPAVTPAPAAQPAPASPAAAVPDLSPAQAKAQAQKLAMEGLDQLQNGDEALARGTLERALELDAGNELAGKLMDQIKADAEKDLGPVSFRYTVQRDDSLSKLAQQFLGDRLRFYLLAKYNGITNPSRLAVGQVLRIPGKPPAAGAAQVTGTPSGGAGAPTTVRAQSETDVRATARAAPAPRDASGLIAQGMELQQAGDLEGAYAVLSEAVRKDPANRDAMLKRNSARQALIGVYEREAAQAFQRQNLDLAIAKWDRIIELDPTHRKARLERERALDLQKKMNEKFGAK